MSSPITNPWQDRRGMFQKGKEVHEPGRRPSGSGVAEAVRRASVSSVASIEKTITGSSAGSGGSPSSPTSQRRRSSAAGQYGNLTNMKRGSQDYAERRASHTEQAGAGGIFSGWYNATFRGMKSTPSAGTNGSQQNKNGIME